MDCYQKAGGRPLNYNAAVAYAPGRRERYREGRSRFYFYRSLSHRPVSRAVPHAIVPSQSPRTLATGSALATHFLSSIIFFCFPSIDEVHVVPALRVHFFFRRTYYYLSLLSSKLATQAARRLTTRGSITALRHVLLLLLLFMLYDHNAWLLDIVIIPSIVCLVRFYPLYASTAVKRG